MQQTLGYEHRRERNLKTKRRSGVAVALLIFLIGMIVSGFAMIVLDQMFGAFRTFGQGFCPVGCYDANVLSFFILGWTFMPLIVLIVYSVWVFLRAQESGVEVAGG